ncbi:MAG: AmmeMemoRadiSam system radical SAM enzyme [Desulfobulbaceae bacterium]|jgi:pyruvate formate lyase activating enzyme|nr:AmmeMemoRadiSam system radical SAM enzyme [Desulfobulbaceae bacterium]
MSVVTCGVCAHACRFAADASDFHGLCHTRRRRGAAIESLVYGRIVAEHVDPIEKKPLFHVSPASLTYSIATVGCNFRCRHCQNSGISQVDEALSLPRSGRRRSPDEIVAAALACGCRSISYTYVEPTVFIEFALDCCRAAKEAGLGNIFVSNGFMSAASARLLATELTAINIDLKSFSDTFYRDICGGRLQPVLDNIAYFCQSGVWLEVTTLLIPGLNDSQAEIMAMADFLAALNPDIPWHLSGFHPAWRLRHIPPTPAETLTAARRLALARGLRHVYTGNRPGAAGERTICPGCGTALIRRDGYRVIEDALTDGTCPRCRASIPGLWG